MTAATKLAVNVTEAAERLSMAPRAVWAEIEADRLRSFKVGKRRLIRVVDLESYLERRVLLAQGVTPRRAAR